MSAHVVTLSIEQGRLVSKLTCTFDRADTERPCWARDIDHLDRLDPDGVRYCNFEDWLDGCGEDILDGELGAFVVEAEWPMFDALVLHVVGPAPVPVPEPSEGEK